MAHNINSIAWYGEVPWHKLGTEVKQAMTSAEAIVEAKLDWEVKCGSISVMDTDLESKEFGKEITIPNHFCTVRMDTRQPLGIVGKLYTPIQNKDAFSFFDALVGEKKAMYHVAGALGQGETVWILAKLPDDIRIEGTDDITNKFLLLTNNHNGTRSLRMFFTPIRVVCQNTLTAALDARGNGEGVVLRHFPDIHKRVAQAQEILGIITHKYEYLNVAFNALAKVQVDEPWLKSYIEKVMPIPPGAKEASVRLANIRQGMLDTFESACNMLPGIKGTAWAAYNAVTEFVDHTRIIPKTEKDHTRRLESIWTGSGAVIKERALNTALETIGFTK